MVETRLKSRQSNPGVHVLNHYSVLLLIWTKSAQLPSLWRSGSHIPGLGHIQPKPVQLITQQGGEKSCNILEITRWIGGLIRRRPFSQSMQNCTKDPPARDEEVGVSDRWWSQAQAQAHTGRQRVLIRQLDKNPERLAGLQEALSSNPIHSSRGSWSCHRSLHPHGMLYRFPVLCPRLVPRCWDRETVVLAW